MSYRSKWTIGMSIAGLAVALVVFLITDSVLWAIVGLLAAGPVIGMFVRPRRQN